jgi:hypothetical protein
MDRPTEMQLLVYCATILAMVALMRYASPQRQARTAGRLA